MKGGERSILAFRDFYSNISGFNWKMVRNLHTNQRMFRKLDTCVFIQNHACARSPIIACGCRSASWLAVKIGTLTRNDSGHLFWRNEQHVEWTNSRLLEVISSRPWRPGKFARNNHESCQSVTDL